MPDVHRIRVTDTGGPEGGNSAYLLPDRGVLVDPGPPGDGTVDRLVAGVEDAGHAPADVDHVLVTHWHADHTGAAPAFAERVDASIAMHEADAPLLADYARERERRLERDKATLREWGVPADRAASLVAADSPSPVPDTVPVTPLADGDVVVGVETVHTPGHTAGHVAFVLEEEGFVGDSVLRTVTPNVGGGDTRQVDPLGSYRDTLARLERRVTTAHPGHGEAFPLAPRAAELRAHHRERTERVLEALADADGPVTPWAVATDLFGDMEAYHVKFGAGEAFAHLAHLHERGVVDRTAWDPMRYVLSGESDVVRDEIEALWPA
jgi:glyoxylase-like metal-dependent hydrolase (beta-lactamase superfamily II)